MLKLLLSVFKRLITAVTSPFRMMIVRFQRLFNVNILTAKLIPLLTKKVRALITLKPQSQKDYFSVGRYWVYKKLMLTVVFVLCAGVFLYFTMFAPKVSTQPVQPEQVLTTVTYDYDDMTLASYTGTANIRAADGTVVYSGDVAAGVCTGTGTLWDLKGRLVYEGGFGANRYSGQGTLYWTSGNVRYTGEFAENKFSGEGTLYAEDGETVVYAGSFKNGVRDGDGKAYSETGALLYEGAFSEDAYHGTGTLYSEDGTVRYTGEFFRGQPQGTGTLYSAQGRELYTGAVYDGKINYSALVGATLADLEAAFTETPRIYYTNAASVFVYEEAGVIVTMDCRVRVDTWENENAQSDEKDVLYYMPTAAKGSSGVILLGSTGTQGVSFAAASPGRIEISHTATIQPGGGTSSSSSSAPSSASSSSSSSSSASSSSSVSSSSSSQSASSSAQSEPQQPEFVEKNLTLYFEIDSNVWQAEDTLDKTKVFVSAVTVFGDNVTQETLPEDVYEVDKAPSLEDCVAIRCLREETPTAFSNVTFQLDEQNKLFLAVSGINQANQITRFGRDANGLTYEYCYPYTAAAESSAESDSETEQDVTPMYYTIRKG